MLNITRSGPSGAILAADLRTLQAERVPLVAAKALTFTAQKAQADIIAGLRDAFAGGATTYTLRSTFIEPATPAKLDARVAVKDESSSGNIPENYLFPSVFGGGRREKAFERVLRRSNLLIGDERAMPGDMAPLDSFGNFKAGQLRTLLNSVAGMSRGPSKRTAKGRSGSVRGDMFVGTPNKPGALPGVYRRKGRRLEPLLVFVKKQPTYRKRFDFDGIARAAAEREFQPTFARLLAKELA